MPNEVTTKEYWEKYWGKDEVKYPNYDVSMGSFYSYKLLLKKYIAETMTRLGKKKLRIIDCGCGEGLILRFLAEQFDDLEIWGIEYSDSYKKSISMADDLGFDANVIKGDLLEGWDQEYIGYFDVVISVGLIEHFKEPTEILEQMARALIPGGCFITIIPNFNGLFDLLWRLYDRENYSYHVPIKKKSLIELHERLHLDDVDFYTLGTPMVSSLHNTHASWQRALKFFVVNLNGRVLQRIFPRQAALDKLYPSTSTVACAGYKKIWPLKCK